MAARPLSWIDRPSRRPQQLLDGWEYHRRSAEARDDELDGVLGVERPAGGLKQRENMKWMNHQDKDERPFPPSPLR